jgi:anti-sigma factor RsiW
MITPQETSHERFEADLAELAAGVLDRREEAALLNHLASCPRCADEFEQLASAAKTLLQLVLKIEPPVGFETRLWDRIESSSSGTDSR